MTKTEKECRKSDYSRMKKRGGTMGKEKVLSGKERLFCFYFSEGRDGRGAAARAGYTVFPEKAAAKLLLRDDIRRELEKVTEKRTASMDEVCAGYRRLAFGSVTDALRLLFTEEVPNLETLEQLDMLNVSDVKRPKGGGLEIKFFDRLKALERLKEMNETGAASNTAVPFYEALERGAKALEK
ncbi:MAG: terminase small subunit [Eubacteriales bacterium]